MTGFVDARGFQLVPQIPNDNKMQNAMQQMMANRRMAEADQKKAHAQKSMEALVSLRSANPDQKGAMLKSMIELGYAPQGASNLVANPQNIDSMVDMLMSIRGLNVGGLDQNKVRSTKILESGAVINVLQDGTVSVKSPSGEEVTGEERDKLLEKNRELIIGLATGKAGGTAKGKTMAEREQGYIDNGLDAADALGNLTRVSQLLDGVKTGGIDNVSLKAKQLFGVESADEAELSARLGKSVLAQLKPLFGAAFTAAEGKRLETIEAGFGKSTEGNKRLINDIIKTTERAARRGLAAAKSSGDDFTAGEIQAALDAIKDIKVDIGAQTSSQPAQTSSQPDKTIGRFKIKVK